MVGIVVCIRVSLLPVTAEGQRLHLGSYPPWGCLIVVATEIGTLAKSYDVHTVRRIAV